jgi:hypothetical protein
VLARIAEPLILIDWSDLKADQSLYLLRDSLPVGGRFARNSSYSDGLKKAR